MNPHDPDAWAVHADALSAAGDPRGRWIALSLAAERGEPVQAEVERWFFEHRRQLVGPVADSEDALLGWWRGVVVGLQHTVEGRCAPAVEALAGLDLRWLRAVRLCGNALYDDAIEVLLAEERPELARLELGPTNPGAGRLDAPVGELLERCPALVALRLERCKGSLVHPGLQRLQVTLGPGETLDLSGLPALVHLTVVSRRAIDRAQVVGFDGPVAHNHAVDGFEPLQPLDPHTDPLLTPARQERLRCWAKGRRFVTLRRRGNALVRIEGKRGRPGRAANSFHGRPYDAARAYRAAVVELHLAGFVETWAGGLREPPSRPR